MHPQMLKKRKKRDVNKCDVKCDISMTLQLL